MTKPKHVRGEEDFTPEEIAEAKRLFRISMMASFRNEGVWKNCAPFVRRGWIALARDSLARPAKPGPRRGRRIGYVYLGRWSRDRLRAGHVVRVGVSKAQWEADECEVRLLPSKKAPHKPTTHRRTR